MSQTANANAYSVPHRLTIGASLLRGQYVIRDYLADGGFAQAYMAEDSLGRLVVIKECYPSEICMREGGHVRALRPEQEMIYRALVAQFVKEARRLARLAHPNIVQVHQVFEENGTAYMALDHIAGDDLQTVLEQAPERLNQDLVEGILRAALNALDYIHGQGHLHRDISPDNLMIGPDGTLTVIDFGSARDLSAAQFSRPEMLAVKDGYSPAEFYDRSGDHTPASDLYALAATAYHLISRNRPVAADKRAAARAQGQDDPFVALCRGTWGYERKILGSVDRALSFCAAERPQTARQWLEMLDGQRDPFAEPEEQEALPELDPELEARVAELVRTVQKAGIEAPEPARIADPVQTAPSVGAQTSGTKQLVDMFGTPIPDVEAWLREQDRLKALHAQQQADPQQQDPLSRDEMPDQSPPPAQAQSRSLFSRLFGRRRNPAPAQADD